MGVFDRLIPPADPEELKKENRRVFNKLRSDLDTVIVPEEIGIPLLRCDWPGENEIVGPGKDYRDLQNLKPALHSPTRYSETRESNRK